MAQTTRTMTLGDVARNCAAGLAARRKVLEEGLASSRNAALLVFGAEYEVRSASAALGAVRAAIGEEEGALGKGAEKIRGVVEELHRQIGPLTQCMERIDVYHAPAGEALEGMRQYSFGAIRGALLPAMGRISGGSPSFGAEEPAAFSTPEARERREPEVAGVPLAELEANVPLETLMEATAASFARCAELLEAALTHMGSAQDLIANASGKLKDSKTRFLEARGSMQGKAGENGSPGMDGAKSTLQRLIDGVEAEVSALEGLTDSMQTILSGAREGFSSVLGGMGLFLTGTLINATGAEGKPEAKPEPRQDEGELRAAAVASALDGDLGGIAGCISSGNCEGLGQALYDAAVSDPEGTRATNAVNAIKAIAAANPESGAAEHLHTISTAHSNEEVRAAATAAMVELTG
jgi:hypothetical protein